MPREVAKSSQARSLQSTTDGAMSTRGPASVVREKPKDGQCCSHDDEGKEVVDKAGIDDKDVDNAAHDETDLVDAMDHEGFAGPSQKVVKPLTPEGLAAFNAEVACTGVIYISRIPPGMRPEKVRHLMTRYGEVGRVYLQKEGKPSLPGCDAVHRRWCRSQGHISQTKM